MPSHFRGSLIHHWKLIGLAAVLLTASASTVYAYWRITTAPSSPTLYVTASYPPLELSMQLEKTEFASGEKVAIHFTLRNLEDRQVNVTFSYSYDYFEFKVLDTKNTQVFEHFAPFPSWNQVSMAPHEQLSKTEYWDQIYSTSDEYGQKVPAGRYRIVGSSGSILYINTEVFVPLVQIELPPLQITINS